MKISEKKKLQATSRYPVKIAVTGNAGSGKSIVCKCFSDMGITVISADELAREVVKPGTESYKQIVEHFGEKILSVDKTLDRPRLRKIISNDDADRRALESFTHPEIIRRMQVHIEEAGKAGKDMVVVEVPLLFESGLQAQFDYVVLVIADKDLRLKRLVKRDGISIKSAEDLIAIQLPDEKKETLSDFIIKNNSDLCHIIESVKNVVERVNLKSV